MHSNTFQAICSSSSFPLLSAGKPMPTSILACCDNLAFFSPQDVRSADEAMASEGTAWPLYGDTRWPSSAVWVEFQANGHGFWCACGVLILHAKIPDVVTDPFAWAVAHDPMNQVYRSSDETDWHTQRLSLLRKESANREPAAFPAYVQSYCFFRASKDGCIAVGTYHDLLDADGVVIPKYRLGGTSQEEIEFARFCLHSVFRLNAARMRGLGFVSAPQLQNLQPAKLTAKTSPPHWTKYHPSRTLRSRRSIWAMLRRPPTPPSTLDTTFLNRILEARRTDLCLELLSFAKSRRPLDLATEDANACLAAIAHHINGGPIIVIPNTLAAELASKAIGACSVSDLQLPFHRAFLTFRPPSPVSLAPDLTVDGCYVTAQNGTLLLAFTTQRDGVDYVNSVPIACVEPLLGFNLTTSKSNRSLREAINDAIERFLSDNSAPLKDTSQEFKDADGRTFRIIDVSSQRRQQRMQIFQNQEPALRSCLAIVLNALQQISSQPTTTTTTWDNEPAAWVKAALEATGDSRRIAERKRDALLEIAAGDFTKVILLQPSTKTKRKPKI